MGTTDIVQAWDDGTNLNVKIGNGATASIARPTVSAGTTGYTMGQNNGASTLFQRAHLLHDLPQGLRPDASAARIGGPVPAPESEDAMSYPYTHRTIIVPAAFQQLAQGLCEAAAEGDAGKGMFTTGLIRRRH